MSQENFLKIRRAWAHINMTIWQKWALNLRDSNLALSKYRNLYLLVRDIFIFGKIYSKY